MMNPILCNWNKNFKMVVNNINKCKYILSILAILNNQFISTHIYWTCTVDPGLGFFEK